MKTKKLNKTEIFENIAKTTHDIYNNLLKSGFTSEQSFVLTTLWFDVNIKSVKTKTKI